MGLSSPGRLHDLFVKLEVMSPGEFKAGGTELQIRYGIHTTLLGECLIALTPRGICNLHFLETPDHNTAEQLLRSEWFNADLILDQQATQEIRDGIFQPIITKEKPLVVCVKGTNFQIQVWRFLLNIPFGGITTYQNIAKGINSANAARAVGNALSSNPVAYLIPCHRVIRESGALGGFRWGLERKSILLSWEASQIQNRE